MSEGGTTQTSNQTNRRSKWLKRLLPLFGVTGALLTMVVAYLGYDYVSVQASPCESIFRQTAVGLSTKINFLKTEGEVQIGREPLVELTERAQMTALNLKTCCTVLDAGKLDPEQFLQCKSKARQYEARVEEIVTLVQKAPATAALTTGSTTKPTSTETENSPTAAVIPPSKPANREKIRKTVVAARAVSKDFNNEVVKVRKAQAVEQLQVVPPRHVDVSAKEREPNNDNLNTNVIPLGKWITASIGDKADGDVFAFTTPDKHRDWIKIELENRSTTLRPKLSLFDENKAHLGDRQNKTAGGNAVFHFVALPQSQRTFRVSDYYAGATGAYLVRVTASKSYDSYEPNDAILTAKEISPGETIKASIMDAKDGDYYRLVADKTAKQIEIKIANQSTTLRPNIILFDSNKSNIASRMNKTAGGDATLVLDIQPGKTNYIYVGDYYAGASGAYEMTVTYLQ
ncbi:MAG: hypothetical protein ACRBCJ_12420 [Hyphomicrobiaceae bacterium]